MKIRNPYRTKGTRTAGWDRPHNPGFDQIRFLDQERSAHWSFDAPEVEHEPMRGWRLTKLAPHGVEYDLGRRGPLAERKLPEFVLVRTPGTHDLFQVEHTGTGWRLTSPRELPAAKLALATMRSVMGKMGRVS